MRLFVLYLKSRTTILSGVVIVVVALLAWAGSYLLLLSPFAAPELRMIPVIIFAPLTLSCIAGIGTHNPFGELEMTSSYRLAAMRLLHLAALTTFASFALSLIASGWNLPGVSLMLTRNILGLSGVAFISSWLIGGGLSWLPPFVFAVAVQLNGRSSNGELDLWAWPLHPPESLAASSLAAVIFAAGLFLITLNETGYVMKLMQMRQTQSRKGAI